MRKKSIVSILILFSFLNVTSFGLFFLPVRAETQNLYPEYEPAYFESGLVGDLRLPELNEEISGEYVEVSNIESTPPVGTRVQDFYLDYLLGEPWMELYSSVGNVEVWVADYLAFPEGDPRNDDPYNTMITHNMTDYIAQQFNDIIYPKNTQYFGTPFDRYGINTNMDLLGYGSEFSEWLATDNPQRTIIKILNYPDQNYVDPEYPYYVVGFFSSDLTDFWYDRNMIHLDCWRWWQRLGPEGFQWFPNTRPDLSVTRPHVYDSTTAHEHQHLIHHDWQPNGPTFMNEGCSMYAELLCGYPVDASYIESFLYTPDNSLTVWGDQGDINILADYGQTMMWTVYLTDHYSTDDTKFLTYYMELGSLGYTGIDAIDKALDDLGWGVTFDDVFNDWRIANLIHWGDGKYNYDTIDLSLYDPPRVYEVHGGKVKSMKGSDFGNTETILGYDTGVELVSPYGTDYICFPNLRGMVKINFDGDDSAYYGWRFTSAGEWWTGMAPWLDTVLRGVAYVDPANPILTIHTYWDIEDYYDFGFVQVSTDDGMTWTSLENEYTTYLHYSDADPSIVANLPGLTSWSSFVDEPPYPNNDGWITMDFNLTDYAGETVMIGFRYMTDPYTNYLGWLIDDASVSGTPLDLQVAEEHPAADFMVTLVKEYTFKQGRHTFKFYIINDEMKLNDFLAGHENEWVFIKEKVFLLVSPKMLNGEADYSFSVKQLKWHYWH